MDQRESIAGFYAPVHRALTGTPPSGRRASGGRDHQWHARRRGRPGPPLVDCRCRDLAGRPSGGGLGHQARSCLRRRRAATSSLPAASCRVRRTMMNLTEYRRRSQSLADFLPWAALVEQGVILNKDGSLQRTARFRGPDLELGHRRRARGHHVQAQQCPAAAGLRLGHLRRSAAPAGKPYPDSHFPDPASTPRRCRAPRAIRRGGGSLREPVFSHPRMAAAGRRCGARRGLALRGPVCAKQRTGATR